MLNQRGNPLTINDGQGADGNVYSFDEGHPDDDWGCREYTMQDVRERLFELIDATPNLTWMLLTKRPELVRSMWPQTPKKPYSDKTMIARRNIWIGTSVSDQETADKMIPELLKLRPLLCSKLFVSCEPMLGPVDFTRWLYSTCQTCADGFHDPETGIVECSACDSTGIGDDPSFAIDQIIFGGESGPGARPCNVQWIRDGVRQCKAAGVAAFVKQLGAWPMSPGYLTAPPAMEEEHTIVLKDKKGGDPSEWPEDLRVREVPA